jgi:hypothetical protein
MLATALCAASGLLPPSSAALAAPSSAQVAARATTQVAATHDAGMRKLQAILDRAIPRINKVRNAYATEEELVKVITPIVGTVGNVETATRNRMAAFEARGLRQLSPLPGGAEAATAFTEANSTRFDALEAKAEEVRDQLRDLATPKPDPFAPPDRDPPPPAPTPAPTPTPPPPAGN